MHQPTKSKKRLVKPHPCEKVSLTIMMDEGNNPPVEDEQMFEVEKILAKAIKEGITYYQVQWKLGNNPEESGKTAEDSITWEPEENLDSITWMIEEFNQALA